MRSIKKLLPLVIVFLCFFISVESTGKKKKRRRYYPAKVIHYNIPPIDDPEFIKKTSAYLGITVDSCSNRRFIAEVASWLGVKYRRGGNNKYGTDCSGFVSAVYNKIFSVRLPHGGITMLQQMKQIVKKTQLQEGDILFFKERGYISHVAIYLKNSKFIHASTPGRGVVVDDLRTLYYKRCYYTAGRAF
ncbi:MAG: NlpC/P60 family protein [Bacteroidetes bacterium]|nr:NlpC/P60 family protein [Bacteroidota bacterium]